MSRPTYKEFLVEYYKYFKSFDEVVDNIDDDDEDKTDVDLEIEKKIDDDKRNSHSREGRAVSKRQRKCDDTQPDDKETYNPCKFRQWMELSIAGDN